MKYKHQTPHFCFTLFKNVCPSRGYSKRVCHERFNNQDLDNVSTGSRLLHTRTCQVLFIKNCQDTLTFPLIYFAHRSTLLSHQVPYSLLRSATERTLTSLTEGKFIVPMKPDRGGNQTLSGGAASTSSLPANGREKWLAGTDASNAQQGKQPSGGGGHKYFMATEKGSAVYRSGLPTAKGVQLFDRCGYMDGGSTRELIMYIVPPSYSSDALNLLTKINLSHSSALHGRRLCRAQQTFLLGSRVHAIYVCMMLDDGATWDIFNWDAWAGLYRSRMTAAGKQVDNQGAITPLGSALASLSCDSPSQRCLHASLI